MQVSYSRLSCFANCPFQYNLRYNEQLDTLPDQSPDNALYLGTAIHEAFETGSVQAALNSYKSNYYVITDEHINEMIKLESLIPKVLKLLPPGLCEVEISTDEYKGFIDRLVPLYVDADDTAHYEIWDYKYCNPKNTDRYLESGQLHLYKYYFELTHPNTIVDHLRYVFIPKTKIRQKKTESIQMFRTRLIETLAKMEPEVVEIEYDSNMVTQFKKCCQQLGAVKEFPKLPTRLCDWCRRIGAHVHLPGLSCQPWSPW